METLFWYVCAAAAGMIVVATVYTLYNTAGIINREILGYKAGLLDVPDDGESYVKLFDEGPDNMPLIDLFGGGIDRMPEGHAYLLDDDEEQTAVYDSGVVDLRKLQDDHRTWREHNFPDSDDWCPLVGVSEELGEAAFAFIRIAATVGRIDHGFLKQAQGIRVSEDHRAEIVDAVGDLLLYVVDFANRLDIDLADAIKTTWAEVSARD
jgi:NTP pyrophosphatase (non-canonical NTP hydrolase)